METAGAGPGGTGDHEAARLRLLRIQTAALVVLAVLAAGFAVHAAAALLIPIVIALLLQFVLSPVVRWMRARGLPAPLAAGVALLGMTAALGFGVLRLAEPAQQWMHELPSTLREARRELDSMSSSMEEVQKAADEVGDLAESVGGGEGGKPLRVQVDEGGGVFTVARSFMAQALVCWFLLLFLLSSQDSFLRSLVRVLPRLSEKKLAVEVLRGIEHEISRYLSTITLINLGLGAAIGLAMQLLGLPNPWLWGAMATLFNFVPYAGAVAGAAVVGLVALLEDGLDVGALVVPGTYLALSGLEGMLITPAIVGRRLQLRPVVVFLGVLVWGWLWGVAGALLAIPMLVVLNILCRNVELLRPLGEFLSEGPEASGYDPTAPDAPGANEDEGDEKESR